MKERLKPVISQQNWLNASESVRMKIKVQTCTLGDLCRLYKLSYRAMKRILEPLEAELGNKQGYFYSVKQVEIIFMRLGIPYSIHE